jgi:hypothetical protein
MAMPAKLPKSWPPTARSILLDAARYYYREMKDPWPVPDVLMERAIEWANKELESRQQEIYDEASPRWIHRWESGKLDDEMRARSRRRTGGSAAPRAPFGPEPAPGRRASGRRARAISTPRSLRRSGGGKIEHGAHAHEGSLAAAAGAERAA